MSKNSKGILKLIKIICWILSISFIMGFIPIAIGGEVVSGLIMLVFGIALFPLTWKLKLSEAIPRIKSWNKAKRITIGSCIGVFLVVPCLIGTIKSIANKPDVETVSEPITTTAITTTITTTVPETTTTKVTTTTKATTITTIAETTTEPPAETIFLTTALYDEVFSHFIDGIGKTTFDNADTFISSLQGYTSEKTIPTDDDLGTFFIYDNSDNYVYLCFYPDKKADDIETICSLTYHNSTTGNEITISDEFHIPPIKYTIFDNSKEDNKRSNVLSLQELLAFMFDCETVGSLSETTSTTLIETTLPETTTPPVITTMIETEPPQTFPPITEAPKIVVQTYVLNTSTGKVHKSTCRDVDKISSENYAECDDLQWAFDNGYEPCGHCHPH